jgi:hypothetical protein
LVFKMAGRVGKRRFKGTVSRVGGWDEPMEQ